MIDRKRYVPAFLVWTANKLSRGASHYYLSLFGVGIETWRCLVFLAGRPSASAQQISAEIGMDKASVSRCFKSMQKRGLIALSVDPEDGRLRWARLTRKGRQLHDGIYGVAMERERALLSVLSPDEREMLIGMLQRLHENLPEVERATETYIIERGLRRREPGAQSRARRASGRTP